MKNSLLQRLYKLAERHEELAALMAEPAIINDQARFREYAKEYASLAPLAGAVHRYTQCLRAMEDTRLLLKDSDPALQQMATQELSHQETEKICLEESLMVLLMPADPHDSSNLFLEIRAGAGGHEAAIFAGDLCRMYTRYAEAKGLHTVLVHGSAGEQGGFREVVLRIAGAKAWSSFCFESGVHRVQRVPETEAQGRIHTSTCTVAVLPEVEAVENIPITPADLRIDTFRASGAGGQHVQKTDSAIRITHLPSGLVVECQDERSQHKNRARAMSLLRAKLLAAERSRQHQAEADTRRQLVGTGDRSERIRTYNFPQGRVTDHRINFTLYRLPAILEGDLDELIQALAREHQADLLSGLE